MNFPILTKIARTTLRAARWFWLLPFWALVCVSPLHAESVTVWQHPVAAAASCFGDGFFKIAIDVTRVELKATETSVHLTIQQRSDYPDFNFRFSSKSYLQSGNERYRLVRADGIVPDQSRQTLANGKLDVVLHFQPLPRDTKAFDFIEGDADNAFRILGIQPAEARHKQLFPSYWRDEQTGNWTLALLDDCAIYDNQIWDLKATTRPRGGADITLTRNGRSIAVQVGKDKKGRRTISVDGRKARYAMITDRFLPDYPTADPRTDFVDTDYVVDTVTVVGWIKDQPERYRQDRYFSFSTRDIYSNAPVEYNAELDSLGRFSIQIPLANSAEFFCDWKRCFIRTLLEPGKTYFLLYDFKEGRRLWMGDDARLQNELFRFPLTWNEISMEKGANFDAYIATTDSLLRADHAAIDSLGRAHPTLSARFLSFRKDHATWQQAGEFGQARFRTTDFRLPPNARRYAYEHFWKRMPKPYTLHRDWGRFLDDYIEDDWRVSAADESFLFLDHIDKLARTPAEADTLRMWKQRLDEFDAAMAAAPTAEERQRIEAAFDEKYESELPWLSRMAHSSRVARLRQECLTLSLLRASMECLDSLGADPFLKTIWAFRTVNREMDNAHNAFSPQVMDSIRLYVAHPEAWHRLQQKNDHYLALANRQLDKLILHTGKDLAGITEGKAILQKILEPYRGKIVLIDIWGTWCAPCKEALSHSQEEYARLSKYDLQYLYFANHSPSESWENVIKEYQVSGPNVAHFNLPAAQQSALERYLKVTSFPTYLLVDRQGNVLDIPVDARQLDALEELVKALGE